MDCSAGVSTPCPGARAAHDVDVQVMHLLPTLLARVHHDAKTPFRIRPAALLQRQLGCQGHHAAQQGLVLRLDMGQGADVLLGHQQEMHRRTGVDVVKSVQLIVFIDFVRRNLACDDFAKNAVRIVHGKVFKKRGKKAVSPRLPG